jgi:hypothetical protein
MKTTEHNKIMMLLFIVSVLGFYKFYEIGKSTEIDRGIASVGSIETTPEEVAEDQLDLELLTLQQKLGGNQIKKCYDNRISCSGNRNHSKCLTDKVSHFLHCANIADKVDVAQLKRRLKTE